MSASYQERYFQSPDDLLASIEAGDERKTRWVGDPSDRNVFGEYEVPGKVMDPLPHGLTVKDMKNASAAAAVAFRQALGIALDADQERVEEVFGHLDDAKAATARKAALDALQRTLQQILDARRATREALRAPRPAEGARVGP